MTSPLHPDRVRARSLDFWLARAAIACAAGLQLLVVNDLSLGSRWLAPALELSLLVPLSAATAWNQARDAPRRMGIKPAYAAFTA